MKKSNLEINRNNGKHQVEEQRDSILGAAEKLFLEKGLDQVKMIDIAAKAGITKITLYRYFPNKDEIAVAIHARVLNRMATLVPPEGLEYTLENAKQVIRLVIRNFDRLRDAYRYMGMFDSLYLDHPTNSLTEWTKGKLPPLLSFQLTARDDLQDLTEFNQVNMVMSSTTWFLEKLAMRGELTWSAGDVLLETHLQLFEEMTLGYIDTLIQARSG